MLTTKKNFQIHLVSGGEETYLNTTVNKPQADTLKHRWYE